MARLLTSLLDRTPLTANGRLQRAIAEEKAQLDAALRSRAPYAPPEPQAFDLQYDSAVWKIRLLDSPARFMRLTWHHPDSQHHVVMVDGDRFYRAWLDHPSQINAPSAPDSCVLRANMPKDYKYAAAVRGFTTEGASPVPLADCCCYRSQNGALRVGFTNGMTRTLWLLANHAESFPVLVGSAAEAQEIYDAAGVGPSPERAAVLYARARHLAEQQAQAKRAAVGSPPAAIPAVQPQENRRPATTQDCSEDRAR